MPKGKPYTDEFKTQALELWETSGKTAAEVEDDLGLTRGRLYEWKAKRKARQQANQDPQRLDLQAENRRLRRELEIVTEERDILKKAMAIFTHPKP